MFYCVELIVFQTFVNSLILRILVDGPSKMTQLLKALASKSDDLSLISETHMSTLVHKHIVKLKTKRSSVVFTYSMKSGNCLPYYLKMMKSWVERWLNS